MRCPQLWRRCLDDEGSVTIEAAFGLASLILVTSVVLAAMTALAWYIAAVDMAGAGARAHALGQDYSPSRGLLRVSDDGTWATATVSIPTPLIELSAQATYPMEIVHAP